MTLEAQSQSCMQAAQTHGSDVDPGIMRQPPERPNSLLCLLHMERGIEKAAQTKLTSVNGYLPNAVETHQRRNGASHSP